MLATLGRRESPCRQHLRESFFQAPPRLLGAAFLYTSSPQAGREGVRDCRRAESMGLHTATLAQAETRCIGVGTGMAEERDLGAQRSFRSVFTPAAEQRSSPTRAVRCACSRGRVYFVAVSRSSR